MATKVATGSTHPCSLPAPECPPAPSGKAATSGLRACRLAKFPLGHAGMSPWRHPSVSCNGLLPTLEVLYGALCNSCVSGTLVPPTLCPIGSAPKGVPNP